MRLLFEQDQKMSYQKSHFYRTKSIEYSAVCLVHTKQVNQVFQLKRNQTGGDLWYIVCWKNLKAGKNKSGKNSFQPISKVRTVRKLRRQPVQTNLTILSQNLSFTPFFSVYSMIYVSLHWIRGKRLAIHQRNDSKLSTFY